MATTIQIQDSTKQMLEKLKDQMHEDTYDNLISKMAAEKLKAPKSFFGAVKLSPYSKEKDRMKFRTD